MKSDKTKKINTTNIVVTIFLTSLIGNVFLSARETKNRAIENEKNIASMQATIKGIKTNNKQMIRNQNKMINLMLKK